MQTDFPILGVPVEKPPASVVIGSIGCTFKLTDVDRVVFPET